MRTASLEPSALPEYLLGHPREWLRLSNAMCLISGKSPVAILDKMSVFSTETRGKNKSSHLVQGWNALCSLSNFWRHLAEETLLPRSTWNTLKQETCFGCWRYQELPWSYDPGISYRLGVLLHHNTQLWTTWYEEGCYTLWLFCALASWAVSKPRQSLCKQTIWLMAWIARREWDIEIRAWQKVARWLLGDFCSLSPRSDRSGLSHSVSVYS